MPPDGRRCLPRSQPLPQPQPPPRRLRQVPGRSAFRFRPGPAARPLYRRLVRKLTAPRACAVKRWPGHSHRKPTRFAPPWPLSARQASAAARCRAWWPRDAPFHHSAARPVRSRRPLRADARSLWRCALDYGPGSSPGVLRAKSAALQQRVGGAARAPAQGRSCDHRPGSRLRRPAGSPPSPPRVPLQGQLCRGPPRAPSHASGIPPPRYLPFVRPVGAAAAPAIGRLSSPRQRGGRSHARQPHHHAAAWPHRLYIPGARGRTGLSVRRRLRVKRVLRRSPPQTLPRNLPSRPLAAASESGAAYSRARPR